MVHCGMRIVVVHTVSWDAGVGDFFFFLSRTKEYSLECLHMFHQIFLGSDSKMIWFCWVLSGENFA